MGSSYSEREGEEAISKELDRYDFFSKAPTFSTKLALVQPLAIIETTRTSYRLYYYLCFCNVEMIIQRLI